jgi:hypothetical protein
MSLSRDDLRAMAVAKVSDARHLFEAGRYSNAYYLFGYGVELALKARIARTFNAETIPDRRLVNSIYTHDLSQLVGLSGLGPLVSSTRLASPAFAANWATVLDWSEDARYELTDQFRATAMRNAMLSTNDGVFPWLQNNW